MASRSAVLNVRIVSDASQAARGFDDAATRTERFQQGLDRASVAAGATVLAIGAVAQAAYQAASSLEQSSGAVESVFGAQSAAIQQLAADAAQAVGLSTNSYQELAAVLGSQLQGMGYAGQEAVQTTDQLIRIGADLAATFGGTTSDAVGALSSLLRGERDPIERYGIALNQAGVDAQVAAMGLDTSTPAAERAAQAQATLALVAQQSANAQGAFAREADTAAGQTQRATAEWENAQAALGTALLPLVAEGAQLLAGFAGAMADNSEVVVPLVATVGGLAAAVLAVNAAMRAYAAIQLIVTAVTAASPLFLLVAAIAAIVAAVVLMYQKFDWFRDLVNAVGDALHAALDWVGDAASWVGDLFSSPVTVQHEGTGPVGMMGAAAGVAPVRSASMIAGAGGGLGGSSVAGPGLAAANVVNVNISGALDPVAVGRQVDRALRRYGSVTGGRSTAAGGVQ